MRSGEFVIYPAIDLRHGRVVRLRQGDPDAATVFSDDPAATAQRWANEGAAWLHVVNLDGALGGEATPGDAPINLVRLREIREAAPLLIQYGGGIRTLDDIARVLDKGASRAVLGTVAVRQPEIVGEAVKEFGAEAIVVALDARDGYVTVEGWQAATTIEVKDAALLMRDLGVVRLLFTDVSRDGMLSGPNIEATEALARGSELAVIASGGVASLDQVAALARRVASGIEGGIVGQALYAGEISLRDALRVAKYATGAPESGSGQTGE